MPVYADFPIVQQEDMRVSLNMNPPVPIGQWTIQFQVQRRFGGISGIMFASVASGFNGMSGITIIDSGQGQMVVTIPSVVTSGMNPGPKAFAGNRIDSGFHTCIVEGFLLLGINAAPLP